MQHKLANDTPLMHACANGHVASATVLLKAGASTEVRNRVMKTALMVAAENGQDECVDVLLQAGADASAVDAVCSDSLE